MARTNDINEILTLKTYAILQADLFGPHLKYAEVLDHVASYMGVEQPMARKHMLSKYDQDRFCFS